MVIDTSAVIAILFNEDDAETYEGAIDEASLRLISVASVLEATIVIEARFGEAAARGGFSTPCHLRLRAVRKHRPGGHEERRQDSA